MRDGYLMLLLALALSSLINAEQPSRYYNAYVTDVYDGDTVTAEIQLGFDIVHTPAKLRLWGINAPELRGGERAKGLDSRDYLREMILGKPVVVEIIPNRRGAASKGKYGRWLAIIWLCNDVQCLNMNEDMVGRGYAKVRRY